MLSKHLTVILVQSSFLVNEKPIFIELNPMWEATQAFTGLEMKKCEHISLKIEKF